MATLVAPAVVNIFCQRFALFWRNFEIVMIKLLFWFRVSTQNLQWCKVCFFFYKFLVCMREQMKKSIITLKYLYICDHSPLKCAKKSQLGIVDEMKCVSHPGPHPTLKQMVPSVNSSRQFFS